jgi:hypothetical protein
MHNTAEVSETPKLSPGNRLLDHLIADSLEHLLGGSRVTTIKNLEAKTARSTLDTLIRIAGVLGVSDQFETLFVEKPKSISQMEQVATAPRVRARRSRRQ